MSSALDETPLCLHASPSLQSLEALLGENPSLHLYALGDLEEPFYSQCRWWGVGRDPTGAELESVTLLFDDGLDGTLMAMSEGTREAEAQRHALRSLSEPRGALAQRRLHAVLTRGLFDWLGEDALMRARWRRERITPLHRMMLPANAPLDGSRAEPCGVWLRALGKEDAPRLRAFLAEHYPETFFAEETLAMGVTIGAWRGEDRGGSGQELLGVSGVHVFAPRAGVASLGHVVVRADQRGKGLGELVVRETCRALRERGFAHIGLNVARRNAVARQCYEKLGFTITHELVECDLWRR